MLEMAIGIEHFSKVHLLSVLQQNNIDPYDVVEDYMNQLEVSNNADLSRACACFRSYLLTLCI